MVKFCFGAIVGLFVALLILGQKGMPLNHLYNPAKKPFVATSCDAVVWNSRKRLYQTLVSDSNKIVFLGDSRVEQFPFQELTDTLIINRGISGELSSGLLSRLQMESRWKPKVMFLQTGINDLISGLPTSTPSNALDSVIVTILKTSPRTQIVLQSVLPICQPNEFKMSPAINDSVSLLNQKLQKIALKRGVEYVNICLDLVHDKSLKRDVSTDGVHLNANGYKLWLKSLKGFL